MNKTLIAITLIASSFAMAQNSTHKINSYISIPVFLITHAPPKEASYRFGYAYVLKNQNEIEVSYAEQGFYQQDLQEDKLVNKRLNEIEGTEISIGYNYFFRGSRSDNLKLYISTMIGFGSGELATQDGFPAQKKKYKINTTTFRAGGLFRKLVTSGFFENVVLTIGVYIHYLKYDDTDIQDSGKNENLDFITPSVLLGVGYGF